MDTQRGDLQHMTVCHFISKVRTLSRHRWKRLVHHISCMLCCHTPAWPRCPGCRVTTRDSSLTPMQPRDVQDAISTSLPKWLVLLGWKLPTKSSLTSAAAAAAAGPASDPCGWSWAGQRTHTHSTPTLKVVTLETTTCHCLLLSAVGSHQTGAPGSP